MQLSLFHGTTFLGIPPSGGNGFEDINPEDIMTLVQMVIQKCLEKEAICNEFCLQLIKQTTEQPGSSANLTHILNRIFWYIYIV